MPEQTKDTLKGYFLTSSEPSQDQYTDLIDTMATETELSIAVSNLNLQSITDVGDTTTNDIILKNSALKIDNVNEIQTVLIDENGFHVTSEDQNSSISVTLGGIIAIDGINGGQLTLSTSQTGVNTQVLQDATGTVALMEKGVIITRQTVFTNDVPKLVFKPSTTSYAISDLYVICPANGISAGANVDFSIGSNGTSFDNIYSSITLTASFANDNLINIPQVSSGGAVTADPIYIKVISSRGDPFSFEVITKGFYI